MRSGEGKYKENKLNSFAAIIFRIFLFAVIPSAIYTQDITLEYIFRDTNIVNPRPSLKFISPLSQKIYYYADEDYNGSLSLFDMNYETGDVFKYSDTGEAASEFRILENGDALNVISGDVYISKNFTSTRTNSRDIRITETDEYEYSPEIRGNYIFYRRKGNYYLRKFDSLVVKGKEFRITGDESDSVSYQIVDKTGNYTYEPGIELRLFIIKYNNNSKKKLVFPDYNDKFVKAETQKRGLSNVQHFEYIIRSAGKDSLYSVIKEIQLPVNERYSVSYAGYSPNGKELVIDAENMTRNERRIFIYNAASGNINEIYSETYDGWFERHNNYTVFADTSKLIFESEISGYNNLYTLNTDGTEFTKIAGGDYLIQYSVYNSSNKTVYFTANPDKPYTYNLFSVELTGGKVSQLTDTNGEPDNLKLSPDGRNLFYENSYITRPSELFVMNLETYQVKQLTNTSSPEFLNTDWVLPELITFNNDEDGKKIYGFVYKPRDFDPGKKYPLICFVHGAGYLQNITFGFSPYSDNFMVNTYLTQKGFIVMDLDFRGSRGYGRDFRNKTFRNLGYWEVSDYISGINYLDSKGYIDRKNIGIYGGSYGGFTTLMAMFRHPELFKAGAALRAVSNWKNYYNGNRWYTLARLGDLDSAGIEQYYDISSPITYAENLQGHLLMTHGMLDDNVFFQDMVQLTQKLIDNKKDFEIMIYPKEAHNFYRQTSWLDQYKRITRWFEKYLK